MGLPLKAIRFEDLRPKNAGCKVPTSGHVVTKMEFTDYDGIVKTGFFKPIMVKNVEDPTYPQILGKYAVAFSFATRSSVGELAGDDRLVFHDEQLIGTISIALPGFDPMLCMLETEDDPAKLQRVSPSTASMVKHNIMPILVTNWRNKEDDLHPGNIGPIDIKPAISGFGSIDRDMTGYPYTGIQKGGRFTEGIVQEAPKIACCFTKEMIDNFPNIKGRTHWPTHWIPENKNMAKRFLNYQDFQALAANPSVEVDGKTLYAQRQFFQAVLQELLTYEPDVWRQRLWEYFGDITLDYLSLTQPKIDKLNTEYPKLFNEKKNDKHFVKHIMKVFQKEYDEFYEVTVFYTGCKKNKKGVSVNSFMEFLHNNPCAVKEVLEWAKKQQIPFEISMDVPNGDLERNTLYVQILDNKLHYTVLTPDPERQVAVLHTKGVIEQIPGFILKESTTVEDLTTWLPAILKITTERGHTETQPHDLDKMQHRYAQIFRDCHLPAINIILSDFKKLSMEVNSERNLKSIVESKIVNPVGREAHHFLDDYELENSTSTLLNSSNAELRGAALLQKFIKKLNSCFKRYFQRDKTQIIYNEAEFEEHINILIRDYENVIYLSLKNTNGEWADRYAGLFKNLIVIYHSMHLQRHLRETEDRPFGEKSPHDYVELRNRAHIDEDVVNKCLKSLFRWANQMEKDQLLNDYIGEIIDKTYEPSTLNLLAVRNRGEEVKKFIKETTMKGGEKLAHILGSGGLEKNSLNTLLIKHLTRQMLQHPIGQSEVTLLCVRTAINSKSKDGRFNAQLYAEKAIEYTKTSDDFNHIYSKKSADTFNKVMYHWVKQLKKEDLVRLINQALAEYEPYKFNFFSAKGRGAEVRSYLLNKWKQDRLLANIFAVGETAATSLNTYLYRIILKEMKRTIAGDEIKTANSQYQLILGISDAYEEHFLKSLAQYAKPRMDKAPAKAPSLGVISLPAYDTDLKIRAISK